MELLEDVAFSTADTSITLTVFKRHVDDVFAVIKSGKEEIFLEHLNSIFPNHISFTIEKEENGRLPFLDALVIRDGRRLKTTVYRKPTHSNRYLHFSSHHSRSVMRGIITGRQSDFSLPQRIPCGGTWAHQSDFFVQRLSTRINFLGGKTKNQPAGRAFTRPQWSLPLTRAALLQRYRIVILIWVPWDPSESHGGPKSPRGPRGGLI
ncbi:hypothetical protein M513_11054 [Trichuris suis]|uniref:Reverse transcriptase domain-containing protein n=1 Tax=Trichuris suis TaxID=68888 RepID=A0A085LT15_9BILA|nr:hypothetical protein M513_11054 [Trichuris suis]